MVQEVVVIEKIIAKEPLTKEMIDAGANVLRHLIDVLPNLKAWDFYESLANRSRIVLSTRIARRIGTYVLSFMG